MQQVILSLLNYVPFVPTCLRAYVYIYIYIFHAYVPSCLKLFCATALIFHVLPCLQPLTKYIEAHFYTCIAVFLWIIWPFIPFKTPKQTPASKTAYLNPITWCFVISTGACTETIIWWLVKKLSKAMDSF